MKLFVFRKTVLKKLHVFSCFRIQRILKERKQKDVQRKQKVTENRKHLANVR